MLRDLKGQRLEYGVSEPRGAKGGGQQETAPEKGGFSPRAFKRERGSAPPPLDFRLLASKRWENKLCCFKSPEFVVLDYGSPGKLIQDSALACGGGGVDTAAGCLQDLEDGASAWPVTIPEQRLSCPLSLCCLHVVWKRTCPFFLKIFCLLDRLRSQVGR